MKDFKELNLFSDKDLAFIEEAKKLFKQNSNIEFELKQYNANKNDLTIRVRQGRNIRNKYLSQKELVDRIQNTFSQTDLPKGLRLYIHATTYLAYGIEDASLDWIKEQMNKHNLKQVDLCALLNTNKSTISEWISGSKDLTDIHKVMFFYLFKALD